MIRRFEKGKMWEEIITSLKYKCGYEARSYYNTSWHAGYYNSFQESIEGHLKDGWKEVPVFNSNPLLKNAAVDPNDLQCPHVWNSATDSCSLCNQKWNEILWNAKPCCGGVAGTGPHYYTKGAWHQSDCIEMAAQQQSNAYQKTQEADHRPQGSKKGLCTCGSAAVGSDRHSSWCDTK